MIGNILLCTDGSECALRAARYTAELALPLNAEVVLVSIFNPPIGAFVAGSIVQPFRSGVTALVYLDRRMRTEALDVTLVQAANTTDFA